VAGHVHDPRQLDIALDDGTTGEFIFGRAAERF